MLKTLSENVFPNVQRPARYLGREYNAVHKHGDQNKVRMVFAFPDLYEVGMSHLGLQILYGLVNEHPEYLMERTFAPAPDMEEELRKRNLPLFSLESHMPLKEFDIIGFTLQYELSATNILNMLDLAGIPLLARERLDDHPLVIAGGPVAFNPEPLADFFDCFVIGEGEEVLLEILDVLKELKAAGVRERKRVIRSLGRIPGVYVPSFYEPEYDDKGRFQGLKPLFREAPKRIQRRIVKNLDAAYFPTAPVIPLPEAVHERAMIEVFRGCTRGCRFCQAGMIYRPVRERLPQTLAKQAEAILDNSGYENLSLVSLSSLDYSDLEQLLPLLKEKADKRRAAINLPSLRVDSFSVNVAKALSGRKKNSLTFAPEAGSQRLRNAINKGINEDDLFAAVETVLKSGWRAVKLYFMVGLPTETEEDLLGIAEIIRELKKLSRNLRKKLKVTVSASSFVPKPHTPFQWEGQELQHNLDSKHKMLHALVQKCGAIYNWHNVPMSFLEAVLARGDRRLAPVILKAWQKGCRFDGWTEYFRFQYWEDSFREEGINPEFFANHKFVYEDPLPWDHIDSGLNKEFLVREHQKALQEELTPDCRSSACSGCGVCSNLGLIPSLAKEGGNKRE